MLAAGRAALAVTAVLAADAATAAPGSLRGRVEVRRATAAVAPRPSVSGLGMPLPPDAPDRRASVVYLEEAPQGAFEEAPRARISMDQRNQAFVPYVLAVAVGTTVEFPNSDRTFHNVFSLSKAKQFDLGRYGRGSSQSVRFDRPGVVRVFCDIHSHMNAFILVFAHRYFATTDAQGRYRIDGVPPGTYRAVAWNEGQARLSRPIAIPDAGGVVELDFVIEE